MGVMHGRVMSERHSGVNWLLRYAVPCFAIGFFFAIFVGHLVELPSQDGPRYVRAKLAPTPAPSPEVRSAELDLPAFDAHRLGPELTSAPWWEQYETNRTLYVAPYTGLANTLQTMGSAFTIAEQFKINIRFVFNPLWFGPATWDDLFSFPVINFTHTFPDGERDIYKTTSCTYGRPPFNWETADVRWTPNPDGIGEMGCIMTCCWREPPYPQSILWFYKILRPALPLQEEIDGFKTDHDWDNYQWVYPIVLSAVRRGEPQVGVHYRRTDNVETMKGLMDFMVDPTLRKAVNTSSAESMLPTENYIQKMEAVLKLWPVHNLGPYQVVKPIRFFLATDHDEVKEIFYDQFGRGNVISFEKGAVEAAALRTDVRGMQLGIIDLFLLASCRVVIGTPFSTFSEVATYIGDTVQLEPDFGYTGLQS